MQDLSGFSVPKGFRGGNAIKVQLWWAVQATIFAWSPQVLYRWRAFLLRLFGAKIGKNVVIRPSVKIDLTRHIIIGIRQFAAVSDANPAFGEDVLFFVFKGVLIDRARLYGHRSIN